MIVQNGNHHSHSTEIQPNELDVVLLVIPVLVNS